MLKIYSVPEAQKSILKRIPPDEIAVTPAMLDTLNLVISEQ